jgi:hypothetical protein
MRITKRTTPAILVTAAFGLAGCGFLTPAPNEPAYAPAPAQPVYAQPAQPQAGQIGAPGDKCKTHRECQSQQCVHGTCSSPQPVMPSGAGAPPAVQACSSDAHCTPPYYCILGTCRPLSQAGQGCQIDVDCVSPLLCIGGVCSQPGQEGQACLSFMDCMAPMACWAGVCSKCTVTGASAVTGTACCDDDNCSGGLYCILGVDEDCDAGMCQYGKCTGGGPCWENQGPMGSSCQYNDDCQPPLGCIGGQCATLAGEGTSCNRDLDCVEPLVCILDKCRPMGNVGDPCATFADCNAPLTCEKGKCAQCMITGTSSIFGTPCCDDGNCTGGLYCIMGACRPLGQKGDACAANMDCDSEWCQNGKCQQ